MDQDRARALLAEERQRVEQPIAAARRDGGSDRSEAGQTGDLADPAERLTAEQVDDAVLEGLQARRDAGIPPKPGGMPGPTAFGSQRAPRTGRPTRSRPSGRAHSGRSRRSLGPDELRMRSQVTNRAANEVQPASSDLLILLASRQWTSS